MPASAVSQQPLPAVNAVLPLALLETVQELDAPQPDGLDEFHQDLSVKRLGMSATVAAQIERFAALARSGRRVAADELIALLRLVGRRGDAGLVFSDAGRRAGRQAARDVGVTVRGTRRALPGALGNAVGFRAARQRARRVFGARMERAEGGPRVTMTHAPSIAATPDGAACAFYGAGFAELLRQLTDFDSAMLHIHCQARADEACVWQAGRGDAA